MNAGTIAILAQISMLYVFSWVLKSGNEWFPEGSATYWALQLDYFRTPVGNSREKVPSSKWIIRRFYAQISSVVSSIPDYRCLVL